jgi:D-inositol-3-phosphate glycosyltransferase
VQKLNFALLSIHSCPLGRPGGKDTGGMNVYVRELARQLGKQGHWIDVFTHLHDAAEPEVMALGENARLVHLRSGKEDADKQTLYNYLPEIAANLERFRRREEIRYDLIYSHYWLSGWTGRLVNSAWHVPHLTMFHTLGAVKNSLGIGENEPPLRIESEQQLMRECDRIIASTRREKETLRNTCGIPPEKVAVIPCGVDLELFRPIDRAEARRRLGIKSGKIILFAGRIEKIKGLDRLIEAMAMLDHISDLKLLVIGGDENSQEEIARLKNMGQELGVSGKVDFRASVPQESLPAFYSAADVFVLPSYYESFGMAALEALACGTPVVTTPVGDWENIIRPGVNGYIAPDNSPPHLARMLSLALTESSFAPPDLIHSTVARFGWENIAKQTLEVCTELLSKESEKVHEKR